MERRMFNILHMGVGFMFLFIAFQTFTNVQKTVLDSVKNDDSSFTGDAYTSLAIIYAVFSLGNWLAPSVIGSVGPRMAMVLGSITYLAFIVSFLKPMTWLLYLASGIIGLGAAIIWTGQGNYLTLNSDDATISRNSGIFWAILQCSMLFGNLFVFMAFQGKKSIDEGTRFLVSSVLSVVCAVGVVFLLLLRPPVTAEGDVITTRAIGPVAAFLEAIKMMGVTEMYLLFFTFLYSGFELSFFSGVYSPSIGSTLSISDNPKELTGLSGICIGIGEITGGLLFGLLSAKTTRWGRDPIVVLGFIVHMLSFALIFLNIPNEAPLRDTHEEAYIKSSAGLALFCSVLLGFGDACYNTQLYAAIGTFFSDNSAPAFAIFKFSQSLATALAFIYSTHVGLYVQLGIMVVTSVLGTATFVAAEMIHRRRAGGERLIGSDHTD